MEEGRKDLYGKKNSKFLGKTIGFVGIQMGDRNAYNKAWLWGLHTGHEMPPEGCMEGLLLSFFWEKTRSKAGIYGSLISQKFLLLVR